MLSPKPLPARLATLRDNRDALLDLIAADPARESARRTARRRPVRVVPPSRPDQHRTGRGSPGLRHPTRGRSPLRHGRRLRALSSGALHTAPGPVRGCRCWVLRAAEYKLSASPQLRRNLGALLAAAIA